MERTTRVEINSGNRAYIRTASGTVAGATFDGRSLTVIGSGQFIRLTDEKAAEIASAFAAKRPGRVEMLSGAQVASRGLADSATFDHVQGDAIGMYRVVTEVAVNPVVMIGQMDLVK